MIERNYPTSLDEMVSEMEKHPLLYQHLKIFLSREYTTDIPNFGEDYLAVTSDGFGLYRINDVDYQNGNIILALTELSTNKEAHYSLDIYNEYPRCLFIRWKDIWNIVLDECLKSNVDDTDLLEFIE